MRTSDILDKACKARTAAAVLKTEDKDRALEAMAKALIEHTGEILKANEADMKEAASRISPVMLDRLRLDEGRIHAMADGIRDVVKLPDPVGRVLEEAVNADGLVIRKLSVPIGVIAIVYESRPNVTSDAAALCLKSGNICVLRGGSEASRSNHAIVEAMKEGLRSCGMEEALVNIVDDVTRESVNELMKARGRVDLLIPRGGAGLIRACVENATVPVIETGTGICSIYVDASADLDMALSIVNNAKTQRPSVCNAAEACLVNEAVAADFLPMLKANLVDERAAAGLVPVELRLDPKASEIIEGKYACDSDYDTEFLDYILAVRVVADVKEAAEHIRLHSTHHSEAIVTADTEAAEYFTSHVDSAAVYVNASTRFTDGGVFGLGCEMGISTQRLHARGPMGLKELTTYKYVITGSGQIRK